ncbi:hypothetical protein [Haliangium sp.]|uniref:hypothetical protein n=1 Tax=Haliangium sp. TaxID=2663208 RepID=UPI003D0DC133
MSEQLKSIPIVCQIEGNSLTLWHGGTSLVDGTLEAPLELEETAAMITIADFSHQGRPCRVNVSTIVSDGTLEPWSRTAGGVSSPPVEIPLDANEGEIRFVVVPVAYDSTAATTGRMLESVEPDSWHSQGFVRVPRKNDTPGG